MKKVHICNSIQNVCIIVYALAKQVTQCCLNYKNSSKKSSM